MEGKIESFDGIGREDTRGKARETTTCLLPISSRTFRAQTDGAAQVIEGVRREAADDDGCNACRGWYSR